jgi:transcriptional regulator with XRE-family HTH domain
MMHHQTPYKSLGRRLKSIREKAQESVAEASGAVEIDTDQLDLYERGEARPSEDILLLMMAHFSIQDDEAVRLWKLAGYDQNKLPYVDGASDDFSGPKETVYVVQNDNRIVYTDTVHVMVNNYGVVMNFLQNGPSSQVQPNAVARVGMSLEHARSVLEVLQQTLDQASRPVQKKALPKPRSSEKTE